MIRLDKNILIQVIYLNIYKIEINLYNLIYL
jgi:hypothetical protein